MIRTPLEEFAKREEIITKEEIIMFLKEEKDNL
jgi:hypothetical protein